MLKNLKVWQVLGVGCGLVLGGLSGGMSWPMLGMIGITYVAFLFIIPPKFDKDPRVVSVGFWIATGMVTITGLVWLFKVSGDIYGSVLIAWLILSVILGVFWPLSVAKRLVNDN